MRIKALSQVQAAAVLQGRGRSLVPGLVVLELELQHIRKAIASGGGASRSSLDAPFLEAAQQLGLQAELRGAGGNPP